MSKRKYPVIHFEMPVEDSSRAKTFYESVFGWQIESLGPEAGDFSLAFTTETDPANRMPRHRGAINGGLFKRTKPDDRTKITVLVDDIHAVMQTIKAAGGRFVAGAEGREVDELPGVGLFATFRDPEGNLVTIYEDRSPNPTAEQRALLSPS